ncbi:MAG: hypothetical protein ACFBWO_05035 [Paracoccaceae bacterium]
MTSKTLAARVAALSMLAACAETTAAPPLPSGYVYETFECPVLDDERRGLRAIRVGLSSGTGHSDDVVLRRALPADPHEGEDIAARLRDLDARLDAVERTMRRKECDGQTASADPFDQGPDGERLGACGGWDLRVTASGRVERNACRD